jgi:acyl dehydratase
MTIPHALHSLVGMAPAVSDWLTLDQPMIDAFADLTQDRQFLHTDPVRAAATAFGGTVAHGFLTLSMLSHFLETAALPLPPLRHSVNYGFDRLRFVAPVPAGARIRGRFTLTEAEARPDGQILLRLTAEVEIEGTPRPALVADWLTLVALAD